MKKKTLKYISLFLILTSSLFLLPSHAYAQKKDKETLKAEYKASPLYQGTSVGIEVAGAGGYLLGGDILSSEIIVQTNLKNRFLPVVAMMPTTCITRRRLLISVLVWTTMSSTRNLICRDTYM